MSGLFWSVAWASRSSAAFVLVMPNHYGSRPLATGQKVSVDSE